MTSTVLRFVERAANLAGVLVISAVLLSAAPGLGSMIAASHILGA